MGLNRVAPLFMIVVICGCVSTQSRKSAMRAPSSVEAGLADVRLHNPERHGYEVGDLDLDAYSIATPNDRKVLRLRLESLSGHPDRRLTDEALDSLKEALRVLGTDDSIDPDKQAALRFQEVIEAFNSNFLSPIPSAVPLKSAPSVLIGNIRHSIMSEAAGAASDVSVQPAGDPTKSSFWQPGRDPSLIDFYTGFGRAARPEIKTVCKYVSAKRSFGTHGGFKIACATTGESWKIKFGSESKTEPFNSRIVCALGYNCTPIDYVPEGTRVTYDRALLTEYNSRKDLKVTVTTDIGLSISKSLQKVLNPFEDAIVGAVLLDGTRLDSATLRQKLIKSMPQKKGRDDWSKATLATFDDAFEKTVSYVILHEGSMEGPGPKNEKKLGSWSWNALGRPDQRAMRAFGLFTAWVNAFDLRQNNNQVALRTNADGSTELTHQVSDLGCGFGDARDVFHYNVGELNSLPWDLVRARRSSDDFDQNNNAQAPAWKAPFLFPRYSVIEENQSLRQTQPDDAKWMIRKLSAFTEAQIQDALIAAGFTSSEVKLALEKLLERRKQLVSVFGLSAEFPALISRPINRSLNYDPKQEPAPKTSRAGIEARSSNQSVQNGQLKN